MSDVDPAASPWIEACPACGAEPWSPDKPCWVCSLLTAAPPASASPAPRPEAVTAPGLVPPAPMAAAAPRTQRPAPPPPAPELSAGFSTPLLVVTQAIVFLGLLVLAPGLAIFLGILILPALVRTAMVVRRRASLGYAVSPGQKLALTMTSMFVALVVLIVATVAAVGTFCAVCLGIGEQSAIPVALLIAGVVTLAVLALLTKWIRSRFRRDVERP